MQEIFDLGDTDDECSSALLCKLWHHGKLRPTLYTGKRDERTVPEFPNLIRDHSRPSYTVLVALLRFGGIGRAARAPT